MDAKKLKEVLALHKVWIDSYGAKGKRADLNGANLHGSDLSGSDLRGAELYGADLWEACLYGADLGAAYLSDAYLSGVDLSGANLCEVNLTGADLRGAKVTLELCEVYSLRDAKVSEEHLPWIMLNPRHSKWFESLKVSA